MTQLHLPAANFIGYSCTCGEKFWLWSSIEKHCADARAYANAVANHRGPRPLNACVYCGKDIHTECECGEAV